VTLEKRSHDPRGRVPRVLFWTGAVFLLAFCLSLFAGTFNDDPVEARPLWIFSMTLMLIMMAESGIALHAHIEALTPATATIDGDGVTHRWRGARPREIGFDAGTVVEVCVAKEAQGGAISPESITGYTFKRGRTTISLLADAGFNRGELVRIWPSVLALAREHGTMVGPNLERISRGTPRQEDRVLVTAASWTETPPRVND
jgi:hypothetical protein